MDFNLFKRSVPENIKIVAVSKTKPVEKIKQIYDYDLKELRSLNAVSGEFEELVKKRKIYLLKLSYH